jgi:hypothetical protein
MSLRYELLPLRTCFWARFSPLGCSSHSMLRPRAFSLHVKPESSVPLAPSISQVHYTFYLPSFRLSLPSHRTPDLLSFHWLHLIHQVCSCLLSRYIAENPSWKTIVIVCAATNWFHPERSAIIVKKTMENVALVRRTNVILSSERRQMQ